MTRRDLKRSSQVKIIETSWQINEHNSTTKCFFLQERVTQCISCLQNKLLFIPIHDNNHYYNYRLITQLNNESITGFFLWSDSATGASDLCPSASAASTDKSIRSHSVELEHTEQHRRLVLLRLLDFNPWHHHQLIDPDNRLHKTSCIRNTNTPLSILFIFCMTAKS